jgi:hypothetical protein
MSELESKRETTMYLRPVITSCWNSVKLRKEAPYLYPKFYFHPEIRPDASRMKIPILRAFLDDKRLLLQFINTTRLAHLSKSAKFA